MSHDSAASKLGGMTTTTTHIREIALRSIELMADGSREDFDEYIHPDFLNHEAKDEPPAARGRGPAACWATAVWLREAYSDLQWEIHDVVDNGNLVVVHCTMSGRHAGPFVTYDADGVKRVFPPTGKTFASTQTHWLRVHEDKLIEHWANRDDMGTAEQLGWIPPSPLFLLRSEIATRRARRVSRPRPHDKVT